MKRRGVSRLLSSAASRPLLLRSEPVMVVCSGSSVRLAVALSWAPLVASGGLLRGLGAGLLCLCGHGLGCCFGLRSGPWCLLLLLLHLLQVSDRSEPYAVCFWYVFCGRLPGSLYVFSVHGGRCFGYPLPLYVY